MNNKYYTYAYLREDGTPYYIGKGKGKRIYYKKKTEGIRVPNDRNRIMFLKQNLTEEEAFKHEVYMISVFGRKDLGNGILYNKTNGGDGTSGRFWSKNTREKLSVAHKGKTLSQKTKQKLSDINKGKTLTDETKEKISIGLMGIIRAEETKEKIRASRIGKTHTEESKIKMRKKALEREAKKRELKLVSSKVYL